MHISHLALYPDALCSTLLSLTDTPEYFDGSSRDKRLQALWTLYQDWAEHCNLCDRASFKLFTAATLLPGAGKFPEPSQKILSASASRFAILWCSSLLASIVADHDDHALGLQHACVGALACMEVLMAREGRIMSSRSVSEFRRAYLVYRSALNQLADQAIQSRKARWYIRPKCHHLGHAAYHLLPKNPRFCSNYLDEDFIHKTKMVAMKSHPAHMCKHTLERYAVCVALRWWDGSFL